MHRIQNFKVARPHIWLAPHLLCREDLGPNESLLCTRDPALKSYATDSVDQMPRVLIDTEHVEPYSKIFGCQPAVDQKDWDKLLRQYGDEEALVSVIKERAFDSIRRLIDVQTIKSIHAAVPTDHSFSGGTGQFQPGDLIDAMVQVRNHELPVSTILMSWQMFAIADEWGHPDWQTVTHDVYEFHARWPNDPPASATFKGAKVIVSYLAPRNAVYVLGPKDMTGSLAIWGDFVFAPLWEGQWHEIKSESGESRIRRGWEAYLRAAIMPINDYCLARVFMPC